MDVFEEQLKDMKFENIVLTGNQLTQIVDSKPRGIVFKNCTISERQIEQLATAIAITNLTIENCGLTDSHIQHLSNLPKLEYLFVNGNEIEGSGFVSFVGHNKLNVVWLDNNPFGDRGLALIASLPKISTIRMANTRITFDGIIAVADNYKLNLCVDDRDTKKMLFTQEQMNEFERVQRHLAKKKKESDTILVSAAEKALLHFFEAYTEFERFAGTQKDMFSSEVKEKYQQLLSQYCSLGNHQNRLSSLSTSSPYTFGGHVVVDDEQVSKTKMYIYTKDHIGSLHRTLLALDGERWLVDKQQYMYEGWKKSSF